VLGLTNRIIDRRAPGMAVWLHSRCFTAVNSDRTYHVTAIYTTHHYRTSGSTNGGGRRAFSTEVLFHFFIRISLSNDLPIFEYYDRYLRNTSRPRFYTSSTSHKSS